MQFIKTLNLFFGLNNWSQNIPEDNQSLFAFVNKFKFTYFFKTLNEEYLYNLISKS